MEVYYITLNRIIRKPNSYDSAVASVMYNSTFLETEKGRRHAAINNAVVTRSIIIGTI